MWHWILEIVDENPQLMIMWAAFGIFPVVAAMLLFDYIYLSIFPNATPIFDKNEFWTGPIATIWILGFLSMIILSFSHIDGLHLILIYISMVIVVFFAFYSNKNKIKAVFEDKEIKDFFDSHQH